MSKTIVCPACDGAGWSENHTCERCHGTGNVKRPMTNADRIRAMTDEELALEIMCPYHVEPDLCSGVKTCNECCLDWLRQIVED